LCTPDGKDIINFELWFGVIYNLASVFSLGSIILFQGLRDQFVEKEEQPNGEDPPDTIQEPLMCNKNEGGHSFVLAMAPLTLFLAVFLFTALLVLVPSIPPSTFLTIILVCLAMCGMCGAIATAGIVSTAGLFDSHLGINPFFSGQAVGGVAVSFANFVTSSSEDPSDYWEQHCEGDKGIHGNMRQLQGEASCSPYEKFDWAVFVYFLVGCLVLAACLFGYSFIHRSLVSEHLTDYEPVRDISEDHGHFGTPRIGLEMNDNRRLTERKESGSDDDSPDSPRSYQDDPLAVEFRPPPTLDVNPELKSSISEVVSIEASPQTEEGNVTATVWSAVKGPALSIFLTFVVTLSLFPGWVSELRSSHQCESRWRLSNDLYVPFSFLAFNIGDLAGRLLAGRIPVSQISSMKLVLAASSRVLFYPLFLLCVAGEGERGMMQIHSDFYSLAVQFLFASTNGMLLSCSFMHAPSLIPNTTGMQERSSEMLTFAVSFGLLGGSLLSFPFSLISSRW
jgi:hypothetical protein